MLENNTDYLIDEKKMTLKNNIIQDNDILIDQIDDHNDSISITNNVKPDFNQLSSYNQNTE